MTVLGGLAEFERELIRARRAEGRARAKARGKSLGRPFKLTAHQRQEAFARREGGELLSEFARRYNVNGRTISMLSRNCQLESAPGFSQRVLFLGKRRKGAVSRTTGFGVSC